ncbi:hypothetical protein HY404_00365 [Candidatus Microgenomates bacterium]|nr:hypothetical protein [Candidatus Microgenomates bacterium]
MSKSFPNIFYHSISQARLKEAVTRDQLTGYSKLHHDSTGNLRGIWMSDELGLILDAHYGLEKSDEIIGTLPFPSGKILEVKKPIHPIILQIEGLDEDNILPHITDPHQFFYKGNLDWNKVRKLLIRDKNPELETVAQELIQQLKANMGVDVEIQLFDPSKVPTREIAREINENALPDFIDREDFRR